MKGYPIISILWEDHVTAMSSEVPKNPDSLVETPTLTVGILLSETDKVYLVAHDIERNEFNDFVTFTAILKSTVIGMEKYGEIKLRKLRMRGE